jgi:enterochelin esterase family protein
MPTDASVHRVVATVTGTPVGDIDTLTWSPADAHFAEPLPMLFAHDGPELDAFAELTALIGFCVASRRLPRMRVTLLAPGERNPRYAASAAYAQALAEHVVPSQLRAHPSDRLPVLLGPSLGGLATLHAEWTHPGTFGGLLMLSGSFFTPELDPQERGFEFWDEVVGFVERVHTEPAPSRPQVALGWGTEEENQFNNALMAARLGELGLPVHTATVENGHNFTCWRDLLYLLLPDLLTRTWMPRT